MTDTVQPAAQVDQATSHGAPDTQETSGRAGGPVRRATSRTGAQPVRGGKRRGKPRKRHTVGKVLAVTVVVLALVSGLSMAYFYRHFSGNITELDLDDQLGERVEKAVPEGPHEPLNILVMGWDTRQGEGNNIDGLTDSSGGSDTTILIHLSADRKHAYGVSIPRDSMVDRPECIDENGDTIPAASYQQWNAAFNVGGPACTIRQVEATTGVPIDHYVVVDFQGFRDMVDAIGGVEVCIPETWDDREHGIYLKKGTRKISGAEALSYVRVRHGIGDGSDIGRVKRQQAFIASMAHQVMSSHTLANPLKIVRFLEAATKSLSVDPGLGNLTEMGKLGYQFRDIGLDKIQFLTVPWTADPENPNRIVWADDAATIWHRLKKDKPLGKYSAGAIKADSVPGTNEPTAGATPSAGASEEASESPSGSPSSPVASPSASASKPSEEEVAALEQAGLCT